MEIIFSQFADNAMRVRDTASVVEVEAPMEESLARHQEILEGPARGTRSQRPST
jgi:hypothetical protein